MRQFTTFTRHFRSYGLLGSCSLAVDLVMTRILFRGARLIRFPVFIRGRRKIDFGRGFSAGRGLRIEAFDVNGLAGPLIRIGNDVHVNDYVHIGAIRSVIIGDRVLIASKVFITDHDHGSYGVGGVHSSPHIPPNDRPLSSAEVVIEEDAWIGEFSAILAGVRIGRGSIIGAMTTVTKDIPPYSIAVGSPARVIKRFNFATEQWDRV